MRDAVARIAAWIMLLGGCLPACNGIMDYQEGTLRTAGVGGSGGTNDAGSGGMAGSGADRPCHPPGLVDTFSGEALDPVWSFWNIDNLIDLRLVDGRLRFTAQDDAAEEQNAAVYSQQRYDLADCQVWLEVPAAFHPSTLSTAAMQIRVDDDNFARMDAQGPRLLCSVVDAGQEVANCDVAFDGSLHRWWRFREASGTLYLETSPDAAAWTAQREVQSPSWVSEVEVNFGVWVAPLQSLVGYTELDNVDVLP